MTMKILIEFLAHTCSVDNMINGKAATEKLTTLLCR